MITSADTLFFWVVRREVKGQKMTQNDKKKIVLLRISGTVPQMIVVFGTDG